ncbi:hypothetical protein [Halovivax limisalsi]|uniref:hypothetical protein n=1 Tax=Halovivax limisalsi TaxID=1453760 RepID=UPI001FFC800A|nr:hypothetical protein [Halovivax limisalsi]
MAPGDLAPTDASAADRWYWYVLIAYPALNLLGIVAIARLAGGGSILASSLASLTILILVTAAGVVAIPALWRDIEFVTRETEAWTPDRDVYVGSAIAVPAGLGLLSGLLAGVGVAIAIALVAFLLATVTVCVVYLFNRHRTVGLATR